MAIKKSLLFEAGATQNPSRVINLGFIHLGGDSVPKSGKRYSLVSANDEYLASLPYPNAAYKRLNLDLFAFYVDNLPDFTKNNEGLLKVSINTRNSQDLSGTETDATVVTNFRVADGNYAPSFLYRGVYRNVIFENWINLRFDLFEVDTDAEVYFKKVKDVVNGVPEIKNLDILKGIPYLNLATQLFDSIINTFGKNPDDQIWGEIPLLEIEPTIGGAFLRSGIYVLYEELNKKSESFTVADLEYIDGKIELKQGSKKKSIPTHLLFGVKLDTHKT